MKRVFFFLVSCSISAGAFAQNVGVSTSGAFSPSERLHVDGNARVDQAFMMNPPASLAPGATITIGSQTSVAIISNNGGAQANAISYTGTAGSGQILYIYNSDNDAATFAGTTVPAGGMGTFLYLSGTWRTVSSGNSSGSPTGAAGGDLTGTYPNPSIGTGAVNSAKIADGTVTGTDIAAGTVANSNLVNSSITVTGTSGLTGGGTVALGGSTTITMPNVGTANTYGSATQVPVITTDAQGRVTAVTNTTITGTSPVGSSLTNANIWVGNASNQAAVVDPSGDVDINNAGVMTIQPNAVNSAKIADGTVANADLVNSSITINGTGITGGGTVALGGTLNLTATDASATNEAQTLTGGGTTSPTINLSAVSGSGGGTVTMQTSGSGISLSQASNVITVSNTGVTSISAGSTGLTPNSATTGAVTLAGTLNPASGGTGINTSASTGVPSISSGTWTVNTVLPVSLGGTGSSTQGWVDLTTNQSAAGNKTWTGNSTFNAAGNTVAINNAGTTAATASTYPVAVQRAGTNDLTIGSDASYSLIQSWNSKPLLINSQGNNVAIGGSVTPLSALHVYGPEGTGNSGLGVIIGGGPTGNAKIDLRGGTSYIDYSNDNTSDYDARVILNGDDELALVGANFKISNMAGSGNRLVQSDNAGLLSLSTFDPSVVHTGSGAAGQVTYWSGTYSQAGTNNFYWDNTNAKLGIGGVTAPGSSIHIQVPNDKNNNPADNGIYVYNAGAAGDNDDAIITTRVNGASAGDPFISFDIAGVQGFSMGIDNSDLDKFKIGYGWDDPGLAPRLTIDVAGNVGIGTTSPIQMLDVAGRMNITNGVIQRGGTAITGTSDLGLYSRVSGNYIRMVTNAGAINFYSDDNFGATVNVSINPTGGVLEAQRGFKTERRIYYYKRTRSNNQGGVDDLGNWDVCMLTGVSFRNSDSVSDEDDDYQCNVYTGDISSYDYNENENESSATNFGYTTQPYWRMYSECYQDCSNSTCTAQCINFDF